MRSTRSRTVSTAVSKATSISNVKLPCHVSQGALDGIDERDGILRGCLGACRVLSRLLQVTG